MPQPIRFADCELDLEAFELRRAGQPQPVEPQVLELLAYLADHPGRLITKDELIDKVWAGRSVSDAALASRIRSARRAIGDDGEQQRLIRTVHGRGFRFVAQIDPPAAPAAADGPPPSRRSSWRALAAIATIAALVCSGLAAWLWSSGDRTPRLSVAVLPFAIFAGDAIADRQAGILTDAVTTRLAENRDFFVISRQAALGYKGKVADPRAVGRELKVRYVVSGSVRRTGEDVQVDVQLADVRRSGELWASRPMFSKTNDAQGHDRLAVGLVQAIQIRLLAVESRRDRQERPDHPDAEDLTTRGYVLLNGRVTRESNEQALQLFEAALALDGKNISALLGAARAGLSAVQNQWTPREEHAQRLDKVEEAVNRALALRPDNSFGLRIRGGLWRTRGDPEQAIVALSRAVELDPNDAAAHAGLGRTKIDVGLARETIGHIETAVRISPNDREVPYWYFWAGQAAVHVGDADAAIVWLRRAIEAHPNYPNPLPWLAIAYAMLGRDDDARRCLEQFRQARPNFTIAGWDAAYRRSHPAVVAQLEPTRAVLRRLNVPE